MFLKPQNWSRLKHDYHRQVQTGGLPDLDLSLLFCPIISEIFLICPFSFSRPITSTYKEYSRKGLRHNQDLSQNGRETPQTGNALFTFSQAQQRTPSGCGQGGHLLLRCLSPQIQELLNDAYVYKLFSLLKTEILNKCSAANGGFSIGGFPIWTCPSFFVFLGLPRFFGIS